MKLLEHAHHSLFLGLLALGLEACDVPSGNRPQDKKVMQRQQQLNQVIQGLEREANRMVVGGQQMYLDVKKSSGDLAADAERKLKQISAASERVEAQTKRLEELANGVDQGSQRIAQMAQKAAEYVGLAPESVPADKTVPAPPAIGP
jgi:methyl-accepting chemotaxis protein